MSERTDTTKQPQAQARARNGLGRRLQATVSGVFRGVGSSVLTVHVKGKLRRWCLLHFRPRYVSVQRARRRGECGQCGACCSLANACPCLHHPSRRCLIYEGFRPKSCQAFPIDERDLGDVAAAGGHCRFTFDPKRKP